jgi:hypothetical protein
MMSDGGGRAATLQQKMGETNGARRVPPGQLKGDGKRLKLQQFNPPVSFKEKALNLTGKSRVQSPDGMIRHRECLFIWIY